MRVARVLVRGLFGRSDHNIVTNLGERITILTGPNGSGKTMILRILNALFSRQLWSLSRYPYRQLTIEFDSGVVLSIHRQIGQQPSAPGVMVRRLDFEYIDRRNKTSTFHLEPPSFNRSDLPFSVGIIEDIIDELDQRGPDTWLNMTTGEALSLAEVIERYWDQLPFESSPITVSGVPKWLNEICKNTPVRLIETDRLYARNFRPARTNFAAVRYRTHQPNVFGPANSLAVNQYAEELGQTIRQTVTNYGEISQTIDRTFPSRVLNEDEPSLSLEELQKQLREIEQERTKLVTAGLLAEDKSYPSVAVPEKETDLSKLAVLSVYVKDTKQKLKVFEDLLPKIELFKEIIHARFLDKQLGIASSGFTVADKQGGPLPLNLLSSGEQHELVLFYELLFHVSSGSLILIDEPEISLHIAWQEEFLEDLARVAGISEFDAIVATHSPQIINTHRNLTVSLSDLRGGVRGDTRPSSNRHRGAAQA